MLQNVRQVAAYLTVTPPTVWRYVRVDPTFPRPIKLSPGCTRWCADEVESWFDARKRQRAA